MASGKDDYYEPPNALHYEGIIYPRHVMQGTLENIQNGSFRFRDDDVILAAYGKSGGTWVQFILYLLCNPDEAGGDLKQYIDDFIPFLEVTRHGKPSNIELLATLPTDTARIMKTHLPYDLVKEHLKETSGKVVLVSRNPKDMLVSYYHFYQMNVLLGKYSGSWEDFFSLFRSKKLAFGDWFDFTTGWWESRKDLDLLHVQYEDLLRDPTATIKVMAKFLGKDVSDNQVDQIVEATSFDKMKVNNKANMTHVPVFDMKVHNFMRKGCSGDWRNFFTEEQSQYVDEQMKKCIQPTGMVFDFGQE